VNKSHPEHLVWHKRLQYLVFNWKSDALSIVKPHPVIDASVDVRRHFRWNRDPLHLLALVRIDGGNCMTWIAIVEDNMHILLSYRSPDVGNLFDFEVFPCTEVLNELSRDDVFFVGAFRPTSNQDKGMPD